MVPVAQDITRATAATPSASARQAALAIQGAPAPPTVDELADWADENYQLDVNLATNLGFPVGAITGGYQSRLLLLGSARWADKQSQDGTTYRFGVAVRALIQVSAITLDASLTLPVIAAKVQLNQLSAEGQVMVRGYKGKVSLPRWTSFGVDAYSDYMSSVSAIRDQVLSDSANMVPELLATDAIGHDMPPIPIALGAVYALNAIAHGAALAHALDEVKIADDQFRETVRGVYTARVGSNETTQPPDAARQAAATDLGGYHLSRSVFGFSLP